MLIRRSHCVLLSAVTCPAAGQQWTAIVLHQTGVQRSEVFAVTPTRQGGQLGDRAGFWSGSAASFAALGPVPSDVLTMSPSAQAGNTAGHATLWAGTPESVISLHPAGWAFSNITALIPGTQVGAVGTTSGVGHAGLWHGSAASFIDLHPSIATVSAALAVDGPLQGGSVIPAGGIRRAGIWSGTAQSFAYIGPAGMLSEIRGMGGGAQVGYVHFPNPIGDHAALWRGSAGSWVDLNPSLASTTTRLLATTGRVHVGGGGITGQPGLAHALINFNTRDAWLDLHQFLPPQYTGFSGANAVCQDGGTIYVGGYATDAQGEREAILWVGTLPCYANCDESTRAPALNVLDFNCFINRFTAGDGYANCDHSTTEPVLNVLDFACFVNRFGAGCP
jgi:hypothetical protein